MSNIAVAGGHGNVGRTLVEVLRASLPEATVFALGRKTPEDAARKELSLAVDYSDVAATTKTLADNNIGTVISAISVMDATSSAAQLSLIEAAVQSGTVARFIASDWGMEHSTDSFLYPFRHAAIEALAKTSLQYTTVVNGYFLDFYGLPHVKSYLPPLGFAIDVKNKVAGIPGTGDDTIAVTYTFDVAAFVARLLSLDTWAPTTYLYGDRLTLNELLALAEAARGAKFAVSYDSPASLAKNEITELPLHVAFYKMVPKPMVQGMMAMFGRWVLEGRFDVPVEKTLNVQFPEVKTSSAAEIVGKWKGH
ncbi:hypothetical protein HMPREF1624_05784 [Sporothrix schenckii ATCC 58251]|uniref:NmrA-like domain-containing protein n=1 Tax=Sporothrix schenckii (strain ATCC 58251 / de Perez 2211183) TaxID=1391915 RepID=U7PPP3_SPOS1|nr:hypothetical protein HMPREF1624_05784 [Sporothrix schenckii ATCC 58251]